MFARHGMKNVLRTAGRSLIFFLLIALLVVLLGASLGLTVTVDRFLEECRTGYTTVGVLEYAGTYAETAVSEAIAALDTDALLANPAVDSYAPNSAAFGYLSETDAPFRNLMMDRMVLVVKPRAYYADEDAYSCFVTETLYSTRKCPDIIKLVTDGYPLEDGHYYLVYTAYYDGGPTAFYLSLKAYPAASGLQDTPPISDITQGDGYVLPDDNPVINMAQTCAMLRRSVTVSAPEDLAAYFPFQQSYLSVSDGTMTLGATDCLISEALAELLGKGVGDRISLSVATSPGHSTTEGIWAGNAFDLEGEFTVAGIFNRTDDWNYTVFLAPREGLDLTVNADGTTLGQLRMVNELAQREAATLQSLLPDRVHLTVYDQGYSAVSAPIRDMQRTARVLSAVSVLVGVAFLFLYGYLLVYRQRKVGQTMLRIGASRGNVCTYFLFGTGLIALPACLLGSAASLALSDRIAALVERTLADASTADLRYSSTNISVRRELTQTAQAAGAEVFFLIGAAVFVLALLSCLYFTLLSVRKPKKQRRVRGSSDAKTRSLKGGALKYAALSALRGGFRSLIPLLAAVCALTLFFRLTAATADYREQLDTIRTESTARGYFTDVHGQKIDQLVVSFRTARQVARTEHIESFTVTVSTPYHLAMTDYNIDPNQVLGTTDDPDEVGILDTSGGTFAQERMLNELKAGPSMVLTNRLRDVPAFLYGSEMQVEFLDGWDESCFAADGEDAGYSMSAGYPCVLPASLMQQHGIALGDTVAIQFFGNLGEEPTLDALEFMPLFVVGSYTDTDALGTIYVPFTLLSSPEIFVLEQEDMESYDSYWLNWLLGYLSVDSLVFRIDNCVNLDAVRESFSQLGLSEPNRLQGSRIFAVIEDATFLTTEQSLSQRLWYMERIFPAIYVLLEALALLLSYLQIRMRFREQRTMRSVGAGSATAFFSLWWEQCLLCLLGAAVGIGIARCTDCFGTSGALLGGGFFLLWLLGAAISAAKQNGRRSLRRREGA